MNYCLPFGRFGAAFAFALSAAALGAAPVITQQPSATVITVGTTASLNVAATGASLRYSWFKDGDALTGQNAATLSLPTTGWGDDGVYTVTVMEGGLGVRSAAAVVTMIDAATTTSADDFADGAIDGQWTDTGTVLPPVDPTSFSETDGRLYFVSANPAGASERYLINNGALPLNRQWTLTVTLGLASNDLFAGGTAGQPNCKAGMVVGVANPSDQTDSFDCGLQMKKNEGSATREIFSDHDRDGVRRDYGMALADTMESAVIRLSYDPATQLLTSAYVVDGQFVPVATINPLQAWGLTADAQLRLGLRGFATPVDVPVGRVGADDFRMVVRGGPTITTVPVAQSGTRGGTATFTVQAAGDGTLAYQWYRDGRAVKGATAASLALTALKPTDIGRYHAAITDTHGTTATAAVALTHADTVPVITSGPTSLVVTSGQPATFTVEASGASLQYQWRRDGVAIAGATAASYTLPAVTIADAGFYDVEVSSGLAAVVSATAKLDVLPSQIASSYRLDTSFAMPVLEANGGSIAALARAADGSIYAAGSFTWAAGAVRTNLARFTADLQLDAGYAPQVDGTISQLALQKDGKLIIAGSFTSVAGQPRGGIARLNVDGTLDSTYNLPAGVVSYVSAMVLDASGRVLLAGSINLPGIGYIGLVRLNSDGSVDASFTPNTAVGNVGALALDDTGRIFIGAYWYSSGSGMRSVARLLPDGTIDPAFTFSATVSTWASGQVFAIMPQGDKVVVGGYFGGSWDPLISRGLFRLNSDGSLDTSFSGDMGRSLGWGSPITALGDGRMAVRSYVNGLSGTNIHILSPDGVADPTFVFGLVGTQTLYSDNMIGDGAGGLITGGALAQSGNVVTCLSRWDADGGALAAAAEGWRVLTTTVTDVALATGGGWYVAGSFSFANGQPASGLLRLMADGSIDPLFAPVAPAGVGLPNRLAVTGGLIYVTASSGLHTRLLGYDTSGALVANSIIGSSEYPSWLKVAPGGKPLVAGMQKHLAGFGQRRIARFESDGCIDLSFDVGRGPNSTINSMAVGADDRILIGGTFAAFDGAASTAIARLLPDGSRDETYPSPFESGSVSTLYGLPDGSALVVASGTIGGTYQSGLLHLTSTGAQDPAFAMQSGVRAAFLGLPNGRGLSASSFSDSQGRQHLMSLINSDGTRDESFDIFDVDSSYPGTVKAVDDTGRILLLDARATRSGITRAGMVMLKPDVSPAAAITAQPVAQAATAGQNVTFSVTATGDDLTYQWFKDGVAIVGATGPSLLVSSVGPADLGNYTVTVTNSLGSVTSTAVALSGTGTAPTITQQPGEIVATSGTSATFSVAATGSGPITYQWRRLGCPIVGATGSSYTIPSVEMADAGFYDVVVYSGLVATSSAAGRLLVKPAVVANTYRLDTSFTPLFEREGGCVNAVAEASNGAIYAGGEFTMIAGLPQRYLARFDSTLAVDATFRPVLDGQVFAILPQADGRVVIGGSFSTINGVSRRLIARLNPDGSLDESFDPVFEGSEVRAIAVQSDGKIIVAGSFWRVDGVARAYIARLNANGALDATFVTDQFNSSVYALALQPDGKVLVGGWFSSPTLGNYLTRLNGDGSVDSSFVIGTGASGGVNAIVCQPDGKIVVGGSFTTFAGTAVGRIVRLESSGAIDSAFTPGTGFDSYVYGLANLPDGRIGVGGNFSAINGITQNRFAVLTTTGVLDATFAVGADLWSPVNSLALVSGGRLLVGGQFSYERGVATSGLAAYSSSTGTIAARTVAGFRSFGNVSTTIPVRENKWMVGGYFAYVNGVARSCLVRLNADGTVDPSFNAGTLLYNTVCSLVEQGDGKLLVASWQNTYGHLVRLNPDGSRDDSFSVGTGFDRPPGRLALLPDGRIAVAGDFTTLAGLSCGRIVLLGRDGSSDPSFAVGSGFDNIVTLLAVQMDGRLVVGGYFTQYSGSPAERLARLNPDGSLQAGFGAGAGPGSTVSDVCLQAEGNMVVGGYFSSFAAAPRYYRAQLDSNFTLAPGYAAGTTNQLSSNIQAVTDLGDGRVYAGAMYFVPEHSPAHYLARLAADGRVDYGFTAYDLNGTPSEIALAGDGRILVHGNALRGGVDQRGLLMLKPDVSPVAAITGQPVSQTATLGQNVIFSVTATGDDLTYQWFKDGEAISWATGSTLVIPSVGGPDLGRYTVYGQQPVEE